MAWIILGITLIGVLYVFSRFCRGSESRGRYGARLGDWNNPAARLGIDPLSFGALVSRPSWRTEHTEGEPIVCLTGHPLHAAIPATSPSGLAREVLER